MYSVSCSLRIPFFSIEGVKSSSTRGLSSKKGKKMLWRMNIHSVCIFLLYIFCVIFHLFFHIIIVVYIFEYNFVHCWFFFVFSFHNIQFFYTFIMLTYYCCYIVVLFLFIECFFVVCLSVLSRSVFSCFCSVTISLRNG